jgi:hypothetical protein
MVEVHITDDVVLFEVLGMHRLWALKGHVKVRRENIRSVRHDPTVTLGWWEGWRMPGTHIPGLIVAGTYYRDGQKRFWDVTDPRKTIVVDLVNEEYDRLIIDVENPEATVARIEASLATGKR